MGSLETPLSLLWFLSSAVSKNFLLIFWSFFYCILCFYIFLFVIFHPCRFSLHLLRMFLVPFWWILVFLLYHFFFSFPLFPFFFYFFYFLTLGTIHFSYVVRILLMVPVYVWASQIGIQFPLAARYLELVRDCYEAFVIYSFFCLLVEYVGGEAAISQVTLKTYLMLYLPTWMHNK